ncbi:MAG: hypothetical protein A2W61_06545 [Deltaproteobacteria bacterium RIFCSPLOWO2_01_44_7]|nr:MAG: hypothetical protein A2712_09925 [Deltaproteobacteria bacterium RIFCSPHIGHO2_01_FULL_43_49]OGQ15429.1 MAG: hypothetical protein A3D22_10455 [Deltaproteobacteria bacterium RIFCSPHIGHO2_02_FULL_44_53]OGQ29622.1 MAG: hypothetical protein A3D98_10655 [Deltaproteobacteria bacterium RIFCSPHIGHO2_12_FULL_44_21]OGQ32235.1 MAG: hypothetical protein A2979_00300 [Deltaproteobacteria bacterium RIFCSPLOWO2_01_FULL_45_74]OGQ37864.1 MAG: hypothetical protein A2W61_06545 [Deltaproteobacteria bacterium 
MKLVRCLPPFIFLSFLTFGFLFLISPVEARYPSNSALYVRPSLDGGRFLVTEQSQGLYQWGYNIGLNANYGYQPAEVVPSSGTSTRIAGVIDDLFVSHLTGALGVLDWLNVGIDVPVVLYESFFNFINPDASQCNLTTPCPKQKKSFKIGDILFATKVRILDSDRLPVGLSVQPFVMFPTGSGYYTTGYGQTSGGAKIIFDANIKDRVYLGLNVGYQILKERRYAPDTANAKVNDKLLFAAGAQVPFGKNFAAMADIFGETLVESPFKHKVQTPMEFMGGVRYSPGHIKRWSFTAAGGSGFTKGYGSPAWRGMVQVNYRKSKVVGLEDETPVSVEAPFEEKIIITQKIHFEFNRWNIRPISFPILDDVVEVLKRNPQIKKVRIEGHTDWIGSDAYNIRLSDRRAESVRTYLIQKGVESDRLISEGFGESRPVADNNTTEGRAKNRRTEFTVVE